MIRKFVFMFALTPVVLALWVGVLTPRDAHAQWQADGIVSTAPQNDNTGNGGSGGVYYTPGLWSKSNAYFGMVSGGGPTIAGGNTTSCSWAFYYRWVGGGTPGPYPSFSGTATLSGSVQGVQGGGTSESRVSGSVGNFIRSAPSNYSTPYPFTVTASLFSSSPPRAYFTVSLYAHTTASCRNMPGCSGTGDAAASVSF